MSLSIENPKVMAALGTTGLLLFSALFIYAQAPAPPPAPPLDLEAALAAPAQPAAPAAAVTPAAPTPPSASAPTSTTPIGASSSSNAPERLTTERQSPPLPRPATPSPGTPVLESAPMGENGYRIRFANLRAIQGLQQDAHLSLIIGAPSGHRYRMPLQLHVSGQKVHFTEAIAEDQWQALLAEGRVQRLVDDAELRRSLDLYNDGYTLYVVLETPVLDAIRDAAAQADANAHKSILIVDQGPQVAIALARR